MLVELGSRPGRGTDEVSPRHTWPLLLALGLSLLWRLPSFFDPPWVNDEGTYFAVAQAMNRGYRLYADVWENKPPAIYLLYSLVYRLVGPSLVSVRLLASLAVGLLIVLIFRMAARWAGRKAASAAALLAGLLMGVPFLEGTTANAEVFLAAFAALAVYLVLVADRPALGGVSMAVALLFKAVAGFDAVALGIWLLMHGRRDWWRYAVGVFLSLVLGLVVSLRAGVLRPMLDDAFLYDLGYVGHANGGARPWVLLLKLGVVAGFTIAARRAPFPYLWLGYAVAGSLVGGRFFGHYALQAVAPFALCVALALRARPVLAARLPAALLAGFVALAALCAGVGWSLAASGHDTILARRMQYYTNVVRLAAGSESYAAYRNQIDDHVARTEEIAKQVRALPPGKLLVWGNAPWVYVLSRRLPATPYTSALRSPEVPGETATLRRALERSMPAAVVVIRPAAPSLGPAGRALATRYREVRRIQDGTLYRARAGPPG